MSDDVPYDDDSIPNKGIHKDFGTAQWSRRMDMLLINATDQTLARLDEALIKIGAEELGKFSADIAAAGEEVTEETALLHLCAMSGYMASLQRVRPRLLKDLHKKYGGGDPEDDDEEDE